MEPFNLSSYKQPVRSRSSSSTRATLKNSKGNINNGLGAEEELEEKDLDNQTTHNFIVVVVVVVDNYAIS